MGVNGEPNGDAPSIHNRHVDSSLPRLASLPTLPITHSTPQQGSRAAAARPNLPRCLSQPSRHGGGGGRRKARIRAFGRAPEPREGDPEAQAEVTSTEATRPATSGAAVFQVECAEAWIDNMYPHRNIPALLPGSFFIFNGGCQYQQRNPLVAEGLLTSRFASSVYCGGFWRIQMRKRFNLLGTPSAAATPMLRTVSSGCSAAHAPSLKRRSALFKSTPTAVQGQHGWSVNFHHGEPISSRRSSVQPLDGSSPANGDTGMKAPAPSVVHREGEDES
ncbi:hypothetical protein ZWY2020_043892 [Hordeum vulgare]|nr:hypothetical protein ZWY2020_043892 [Hordeum vulgare]